MKSRKVVKFYVPTCPDFTDLATYIQISSENQPQMTMEQVKLSLSDRPEMLLKGCHGI